MQYWKIGDTLTADSLNRLVDEIVSLERGAARGAQRMRPRAAGCYVPPEPLARPWEVQLDVRGEQMVALVRGGRVLESFGTDGCEQAGADGKLTREARWREPFEKDEAAGMRGWREVAVPDKKGEQVLWLAARGALVQRDIEYDYFSGDRCGGWFGEHTHLPEKLDYRLVWEPDTTALRCWPLAVVQTEEATEYAVVQLLWGDLCLFDVQGIITAGGLPMFPISKGSGWGEFNNAETLCDISLETEKEYVEGQLKAGLGQHGELEFFLSKLPVMKDDPPGGGGGGGEPTPGPDPEPDPDPDPEPEPVPDPIPDPWEPDPDDPDDPDDDKHEVTDPDGYYYEGSGNYGIIVDCFKVTLPNGMIGYRFTVGCNDTSVEVTETVRGVGSLTVSTANSTGTYDWPEANESGLTMYYGVTGGGAVTVTWMSSYQGEDDLPKSAEATVIVPFEFSAWPFIFSQFGADSENGPSAYAGNILTFDYSRTRTVRATVKVRDTFTGRIKNVRHVRKFKCYTISLRKGVVREITRNRALAALQYQATVSPAEVRGECSNIDPPIVTAGAVVLRPDKQPAGVMYTTGPMTFTVRVFGQSGDAAVPVSGGAGWNRGKESGSIDGEFKVRIDAQNCVVG